MSRRAHSTAAGHLPCPASSRIHMLHTQVNGLSPLSLRNPWHRVLPASLHHSSLSYCCSREHQKDLTSAHNLVAMNQPDEQQSLLPRQSELDQQSSPGEVSAYARRRERCQALLQSKQKHYLILALVALDVSCLLADIFITLIDCDSRIKNDAWVPAVHEALEDAGLVFSCLFLAELITSLWAFGFE